MYGDPHLLSVIISDEYSDKIRENINNINIKSLF